MAYTALNLMDAIRDHNMPQFERILVDRDELGRPRVDVNTLGRRISALSLIVTPIGHPPHEDMFNALLALRDVGNNPVVDINVPSHAGHIINFIVGSSYIDNPTKRRMLEQLIDTRGPHGELIINLDGHVGQPVLFAALECNDIHIIRLLLDLRKQDGSFAIDINQVFHNKTVLDAANQNGIYYVRNPEIIAAIQARGGLAFVNLTPEVREQKLTEERARLGRRDELIRAYVAIPAPIVAPALPVAVPVRDELHQFVENRQNTHDPAVTLSVNNSVIKLRSRYSPVDAERAIAEFQRFLRTLPDNPGSAFASACLTRVKTDPTERSLISATLKEIFALVWRGVVDPNGSNDPLQMLSPEDIESRKKTLFDNLVAAQTEYGAGRDGNGSSACFVGTMHKILESLNGIHPDVAIATGPDSLKSIATERALTFVRELLECKPLAEQKNILSHWDSVEDDNPAAIFKREAKTFVDQSLQTEFQTQITPEIREGIIANFEYLPRIYPDARLNRLISIINQTKDDAVPGTAQAILLSLLKTKADQICEALIADSEMTFEAAFLQINSAYKRYQDLSSQGWLSDFLSLTVDAAMSAQKKRAYIVLKTKVDAVFDIADANIDSIKQVYDTFNLISRYSEIEQRYLNTGGLTVHSRSQAVSDIQGLVNTAFENYIANIDSHLDIVRVLKDGVAVKRQEVESSHRQGLTAILFGTKSRLVRTIDQVVANS